MDNIEKRLRNTEAVVLLLAACIAETLPPEGAKRMDDMMENYVTANKGLGADFNVSAWFKDSSSESIA